MRVSFGLTKELPEYRVLRDNLIQIDSGQDVPILVIVGNVLNRVVMQVSRIVNNT